MFKEACATVFLGLVLQGYISNVGKPGYIGIMATTCPPIRVTEVFHGTPAERAGLKRNDTILKVDGERGGEIKGPPSTPVTLMIKRGEGIFNVTITRAPIDEMPPEFPRGLE